MKKNLYCTLSHELDVHAIENTCTICKAAVDRPPVHTKTAHFCSQISKLNTTRREYLVNTRKRFYNVVNMKLTDFLSRDKFPLTQPSSIELKE